MSWARFCQAFCILSLLVGLCSCVVQPPDDGVYVWSENEHQASSKLTISERRFKWINQVGLINDTIIGDISQIGKGWQLVPDQPSCFEYFKDSSGFLDGLYFHNTDGIVLDNWPVKVDGKSGKLDSSGKLVFSDSDSLLTVLYIGDTCEIKLFQLDNKGLVVLKAKHPTLSKTINLRVRRDKLYLNSKAHIRKK